MNIHKLNFLVSLFNLINNHCYSLIFRFQLLDYLSLHFIYLFLNYFFIAHSSISKLYYSIPIFHHSISILNCLILIIHHSTSIFYHSISQFDYFSNQLQKKVLNLIQLLQFNFLLNSTINK